MKNLSARHGVRLYGIRVNTEIAIVLAFHAMPWGLYYARKRLEELLGTEKGGFTHDMP